MCIRDSERTDEQADRWTDATDYYTFAANEVGKYFDVRTGELAANGGCEEWRRAADIKEVTVFRRPILALASFGRHRYRRRECVALNTNATQSVDHNRILETAQRCTR